MFRACICFNIGRWGSQPDSKKNKLDQDTDGDDRVIEAWDKEPSHCSSWCHGSKGQNYCYSFGQDSGKSQSEHQSKCNLLQYAGGGVWLANEEKGAQEAEEEGDEQDEAESPIIGLNDGGVSVLEKDSQNYSGADRQAERYARQSHA